MLWVAAASMGWSRCNKIPHYCCTATALHKRNHAFNLGLHFGYMSSLPQEKSDLHFGCMSPLPRENQAFILVACHHCHKRIGHSFWLHVNTVTAPLMKNQAFILFTCHHCTAQEKSGVHFGYMSSLLLLH